MKSAPSNLSSCKISWKRNCLKCLPKMPYLGIFWIELKKNCCHILNQHIQISLILKFCDKKKKKKKKRKRSQPKYFIWVFLGLNFKNYSHIWSQHAQTCLIAKFYEEIKMPNFGIKNPWFTIFDQKCLIGIFLE